MSSSKSRSVSVEIVPPTGPRPMDLAGAINGALSNNDRDMDRDDDDDDHDLPERRQAQAPSAPPKPTTSPTTGNAPTPCERCVRTNRVCKGVGGARCEYCKRLKQRCTNSSGPARGKNAAKKVAEAPMGSSSKPTILSPPSAPGSTKRKQPEKAPALLNGDVDGASLDGEGSLLDDDDHELPPRLNKKRRISLGNKGPSRSELQKVVSDLDSSVKRIQATVAREVEKVNGVIKTLNTMISEMESD